MRFLIVSDRGDGTGLAIRLKQEGHEVYIYFKQPRARRLLRGMVYQVPTIAAGVNKSPDIILFDMVGMGKTADRLRQEGWPVIGGGAWNDKLELDRKFAIKTMETFGIRSPASYAFDSFMDAAKYLLGARKRLVFKPSNNRNTSYTFAGETQDETIAYITHLRKRVGVDGPCVLQEYIKGAEISTEVWFAKGEAVAYPNSTIETKKLLHGDFGPSTGCQTSVVWSYDRKEPKIIQQSLRKVKDFMQKISYTGPLDINGIVRKGRFYGLEFSPRFGYSAIYAYMRLLEEPLGGIFKRLTEGDTSPLSARPGFGYSLRVSIPPYPAICDDPSLEEAMFNSTGGMLIGGLTKEDWSKRVIPLDVRAEKAGLLTAGFDGAVCECTGYGESIFEAEEEACDAFRRMKLPNKMARLGDGGKVAMRRLNDLEQMGYEVPKPQHIAVELQVVTKSN